MMTFRELPMKVSFFTDAEHVFNQVLKHNYQAEK